MITYSIRYFKNHYQSRWAVMRHNQKNKQKILLINDKFVLKNLVPGTTLCYNCLGEMYIGIIDNMYTLPTEQNYNNVVLINNIEFKNKTADQLVNLVTTLSSNLMSGGRLILSVEQKYLKYDRVHISRGQLLSEFVTKLTGFKKVTFLDMFGKSQPGYGDYFFCFEKQ